MNLLRQRRAINHQAKAGLLDGGVEIGGELCGKSGEVDRLKAGLHASGFDAGKVEEGVDELEQADAAAVCEVDERAMIRQRVGIGFGQDLLQRAQHQGKRRAELVTDV